jgi:hypothetical protein
MGGMPQAQSAAAPRKTKIPAYRWIRFIFPSLHLDDKAERKDEQWERA